MRRIGILAATVVALAGAAACGGSDPAASASPAPRWDAATFASALQGTWHNACVQQPSHPGAIYWDSEYSFDGVKADHSDSAHTDPACANFAGYGHGMSCDACLVIGGPVTAGFGAAQVTAFEVQMAVAAFDTGYFILYIDPADRTRVYGLGRWGIEPALRPTTIDPALAWVKQ